MYRETYTGASCTGNDGESNRTITISNNRQITAEIVVVDRQALVPSIDYTLNNSGANSIITFLNPIWNEQSIIIWYDYYAASSSATVQISSNTLSEDAYNAIYTLLKNNLSDIQSPTRGATSWIFSSFPDVDEIDQDSFPIVIVDKATFTTENFTITKSTASLNISITVLMAGNKAAMYCDQLSDDVFSILNSAKYSQLRNTNRVFNMEITRMGSDVTMYRGLKVHSKDMVVSGVFRYT